MPRTARASRGGYLYHVLNRGNARKTVFHKEGDYAAFLKVLREAAEQTPMRLLAYCLMPNHFHLVLWPHGDEDMSLYMRWLLSTHVRRYHQHYHSSGHVWQGRFKAFPIQEDDYLVAVMRYAERNPLRAKLVRRAEQWRWSSISSERTDHPELHQGPVKRGPNWLDFVNQPQTESEVKRLRECLNRGRPFGDESWQQRAAADLGLEASLNPRGRPRKSSSEAATLFDEGE